MGKKTSELGQNLQNMMKELRKITKAVPNASDHAKILPGTARRHTNKPTEKEVT